MRVRIGTGKATRSVRPRRAVDRLRVRGVCGKSGQLHECPPVTINNPFDVPSQSWNTTATTVLQPRCSCLEIDRNDALRFGYGRSAVFADAQTAGTPFSAWGLASTSISPPAPGVPTVRLDGDFSTVFPCTSYAQQLYWQGDNLEAPDAGISRRPSTPTTT